VGAAGGCSEDGKTPLLVAAHLGYTKVLKLLLNHRRGGGGGGGGGGGRFRRYSTGDRDCVVDAHQAPPSSPTKGTKGTKGNLLKGSLVSAHLLPPTPSLSSLTHGSDNGSQYGGTNRTNGTNGTNGSQYGGGGTRWAGATGGVCVDINQGIAEGYVLLNELYT
jgi:hypothetical protein